MRKDQGKEEKKTDDYDDDQRLYCCKFNIYDQPKIIFHEHITSPLKRDQFQIYLTASIEANFFY